jgi:hypothetical protein
VAGLAQLSYEAAVRALDLQERAVEQLRSRTGILLATSSVTASFLGGETIQHRGNVGTLGALALVSLVVSVLLCVYVLLPKQDFVFSQNGPAIFESLFDVKADENEVNRRLAYWLEDYWRENQTKIESLGRYFFAASIALVLQLVLWSLALADTIT